MTATTANDRPDTRSRRQRPGIVLLLENCAKNHPCRHEFVLRLRRAALVGEGQPLHVGVHATDVPAAEVCELEVVKIIATEGGIGWAGEHDAIGVGGEQGHLPAG